MSEAYPFPRGRLVWWSDAGLRAPWADAEPDEPEPKWAVHTPRIRRKLECYTWGDCDGS